MTILLNILHQQTAVSVLCRCIELVFYYRKHDLYAWTAPDIFVG